MSAMGLGCSIVFAEKQIIPITESQADRACTLGAIVSLLLALWGISGACPTWARFLPRVECALWWRTSDELRGDLQAGY